MGTKDVIPLLSEYADSGNYRISLVNNECLFDGNKKSIFYINLTICTQILHRKIISLMHKGTDETRFEIVYQSKEVPAQADCKI